MPNVAKVAVNYRVNAPDEQHITGVFTFHVQKTDGSTPFDATDREVLGNRIMLWWTDGEPREDPDDDWVPARDNFASGFELTAVEVWSVEPTPAGPTIVVPEGTDGEGTGGEIMLPPQCAYVVGLRTSVDSRRGRGRIYFPAFYPDLGLGVSLGLVVEGTRRRLAELAAHLAAKILLSPLDPDPWVLAVYSRVDGDARAVLSFDVPDRIATQRRRRYGEPIAFPYGLDAEEA